MSEYGYFDDDAREYVITRPDTPLPWLNYLGCEEFFGLISNTGGGYSFYRDAKLRRLTRYRYNNVPLDGNGRYLYVKDGERIWNPTWKPTRTDLDRYECRHGLGYSRITGESGGVEVSVTFFVPLGQTCEVWDVRVTNRSDAPKDITLFSFVEWCLWDALDDMTNFQRNFSTGQVEVEDGAIFHVTEYRERRDHYAYFACSRDVDGFDTSRNAFVGVHEGLDAPKAIVSGHCTGSVAHGWHPIGAHEVSLSLQPGQTQRMHFLLGYAENAPKEKFSQPGVANKAPYRAVAERLADSAAVDEAFDELKSYWGDLLGAYRVEIDDEHVSRMVNTWNPYQCMVTLNLSRSASGYESGIGRGMGYRDSNQDILGVAHLVPDRARQRLCDLAATQLSDGTCFHQYQPLTKEGNAEVGGGFNDDPLWLPLSVSAYIRETGDDSILRERVGYADVESSNATMLEHLELSLRYTDEHLGPHGLPLIGHADWNDCLNLNCFSTTPGESFQTAGDIGGSVAESLMIAGQYCAASEAMAQICEHCLGDSAKAGAYLGNAERMRGTILQHGWDGAWFLRAYDGESRPIGSKQCEEGQIFIESQGWCVMGGVGLDDGKATRALDSVAERLATPNGVVLQQPAFATYHAHLGEVSSYPPGYKENAGIFTHNNTWIQIAETMLGQGDRAYDYYMSICPSAKQEQIDIYRCEPYCYSQMTAGPDSAAPGEAKNSWLTGTASWSFVAISQYILGVRPGFDGLVVDPCIPAKWKRYSVHRRFRGRTYHIRIHNPDGVCRGVKSIIANGQPVEGTLIPLSVEGPEIDVEVVMG
jgi:cellobiose phosphorylase